ncbi:MAG: amidohydrolase [Oligoflexia bacterium]|nr:amidohydrolase [Oligoflexia bacterium]
MTRKYRKVTVVAQFLILGAALASCSQPGSAPEGEAEAGPAELIVRNGKVFTHKAGIQQAFAVRNGRFVEVGANERIMRLQGPATQVIDAGGRTVIPGLIDTHLHPIRAGLNYNLELRWDGVSSLKEGLKMIKEQARRTPEGQWVRVVGGWSPHQFKEKRLPTVQELTEASPERPVMVLYLYSRALLNKAGVRALGYTGQTKFAGGEVALDSNGVPTGLLSAKPNGLIIYKTLVGAPKLASLEEERNSTLQFFGELSRLGLTTAIDAGGGGFFYPEDHRVAKELHDARKLPVKLPFYLFAPVPGRELEDYKRWATMVSLATLHEISHMIPYHLVGGGENLTAAAADFENFLEPRPELPPKMEAELKPILRQIFQSQWIFRIHATYDESISRVLNVVEELKREGGPFPERFIIDHAETISKENLRRIKDLGGGISIQDRMAFQAEEFVARYGKKKAESAPPIGDILEMGIPLGSGTDGTRVSSYNPWVSLYWMVSGRSVGGLKHLSDRNRVSREKALYLMSKGAAWFSKEENVKGDISPGEAADFAILSEDYFSVPERRIKDLHSVLTMLDGKTVHAGGPFERLASPMPRAIPEWSPVNYYGGYQYRR